MGSRRGRFSRWFGSLDNRYLAAAESVQGLARTKNPAPSGSVFKTLSYRVSTYQASETAPRVMLLASGR